MNNHVKMNLKKIAPVDKVGWHVDRESCALEQQIANNGSIENEQTSEQPKKAIVVKTAATKPKKKASVKTKKSGNQSSRAWALDRWRQQQKELKEKKALEQ